MHKKFNHTSYHWQASINYREEPFLYRVGKGEQGVLICEPYKSEILPFWKFNEPAAAKRSANIIYSLFMGYLGVNEFPGADLARKFLQMGFTRARRYANYKGGKKYGADKQTFLPRGTGDTKKIESAKIFYAKWQQAEKNKKYKRLKMQWKIKYG